MVYTPGDAGSRRWNFGYPFASTQITTLTSGNWNEGYYDLALPSNNQIYFYGRRVTHVRIVTDGYVAFGLGSPPSADCISANAPIPPPNPPNAIAAPAATYSFEIILHAYNHSNCPNLILFTYDKINAGDPGHDYGPLATVGIEHGAGTQGEEYSYHASRLQLSSEIWFMPFVPVYGRTDNIFGGETDPVVTVFRPSSGMWYFRLPDGSTGGMQFGTRGDKPRFR